MKNEITNLDDAIAPAVPYYLSLVDVDKITNHMFKKDFFCLTDQEQEYILFNVGFNVKELKGEKQRINNTIYTPILIADIHKNSDNQVKYAKRIYGSERVDSEWLKSGHASYEAKIFTDDLAMIQDIKRIGRR